MFQKMKLLVALEFSKTPGPRYIKEGEFSGELFRKNILLPKLIEAINKNEKLLIDLDGTAGFGTSFLEESFGGLIRENNISYSKIIETIEFKSTEEEYLINDINHYLKDAYDDQNK